MLTSLIAGFASGETAFALRRVKRAGIAYVAAGIAGLCGLGFLVGAAYVWAARSWGEIEAAVAFGLGFLALSGLILAVHSIAARSRAREDKQRRSSELAAVGMTVAAAVVPTLLRSKGGIGALLGPLVALVAYAIYRENSGPGNGDDVAGD